MKHRQSLQHFFHDVFRTVDKLFYHEVNLQCWIAAVKVEESEDAEPCLFNT